MAEQQRFVRLNREQKRVLDLVKPYDGDDAFFDLVQRSEVGGLSFTRLIPTLGELERAGYLTVIQSGGRPTCIALSTVAYCYREEYLLNIVLPFADRVVTGAVGGLLVWALSRVFG